MRRQRIILALLGVLLPSAVFAQSTVLQGGAWTPGHVPAYSNSGLSQPTVIDGGPAGGGGVGTGVSELGITARGTGAAPYQGQGTGPFGTIDCRYDAPITNSTGYHYLCFSPYAQGGGFMAYGAAGVAAQLPFYFNINGVSYQFPFTLNGIVGPSTTVIGHVATWANTVGSLLQDGGPLAFSNISGVASASQMPAFAGGDCTSSVSTVVLTCLKTNGVAFTSAATTAIGTSGATIPLLSTANTWTLAQKFSALPIFSTCSGGFLYGNGSSAASCLTTISSAVVTYTAPYTGAGTRTQASKNSDIVSALDFAGVDPSGNTDSDAGFANFIAACMQGRDCFVPAGTYEFASDLVFDFASNPAGGMHFHGAGQAGNNSPGAYNGTQFIFATGHGMKLINSDLSAPLFGAFLYPVFDNFGVLGNVMGGPVFQVGSNSLADAANGIALRDMWVKNLANASGSQGMKLNEVVTFTLSNVTTSDGCPDEDGNCPSGGDSLQMNSTAFGNLNGSFSGAYAGVHLTNNFNFSNEFITPDLEVNYYDVVADSTIAPGPEPANITFVGGQFGFYNYAIQSTQPAGGQPTGSLIFDNVTLSPATGHLHDTATDGTATNSQGVLFRDGNIGYDVSTPMFPSSGVAIVNTTLRRVSVYVYGGTISQFCYGATGSSCVTSPSGTFILAPLEEAIITYTGSPGWTWAPTE